MYLEGKTSELTMVAKFQCVLGGQEEAFSPDGHIPQDPRDLRLPPSTDQKWHMLWEPMAGRKYVLYLGTHGTLWLWFPARADCFLSWT